MKIGSLHFAGRDFYQPGQTPGQQYPNQAIIRRSDGSFVVLNDVDVPHAMTYRAMATIIAQSIEMNNLRQRPRRYDLAQAAVALIAAEMNDVNQRRLAAINRTFANPRRLVTLPRLVAYFNRLTGFLQASELNG